MMMTLPESISTMRRSRPDGENGLSAFPMLFTGVLLALLFWLGPVFAQEPLDKYGGLRQILGDPGPSYHLEKIGQRWWLVTPEGHGVFIRAVSKVDTADYGGSGGFLSYDGVYLQEAGGALSGNLCQAAESTLPRDVVHPATGVTLRAKGDALYLGSSRFKPNYTYFWLDRLGQGGQLDWYYSTGSGWQVIRGTGKPLKAAVLVADGGWNLDTGNYMAPDENGFGQWGNRQANKVTWWDMKEGFPPDFAPTTLPGDSVARYYLKAVVQQDLDDFLGLFAAHYGIALEKVFKAVPHPLLLLPVYNGPDCVYRALGPYVDGFWVSVPKAQDALRIYNAGHKPLVVADYLTADPDSSLYFKVKIAALRYDATAGNTVLEVPDLRYVFRSAHSVAFPDCMELMEKSTCGGKYVYPFPRIRSARWNVLEVPGDFTPCVRPGMYVEMWKHGKYPYPRHTQEDRARAMIQRYQSLLNLRGDDGSYFVIGFEHWCLYDPAVSNWGDNENFGLATLQDNAYDGREARRASGRDPRGYPIGGEEADYGNLLGPLSDFLHGIDRQIRTE